MREDVPTSPLKERRYTELVRLAYLVLPGKGRRIYRLAMAQRIVDGVLGGRAWTRQGQRAHSRTRTRVLRRAMYPSWRLRIGLGPWLRALPARLPDADLTVALARLDPQVRVAYVLRHIEGIPRYAVRDQLVELGIRHTSAVLDAADAFDLPGHPVELVVCRRAGRPSRRPIAVASVLTILLGATLVVTENGGTTRPAAARGVHPTVAAPGAWTRAPHTLDVWPARGDLAGDQAFTSRAAAAWPSPPPQLLYAGHVDGTPTALLRRGNQLARYTKRGLEVEKAGTDPVAPMKLGGGHYLLSPWTTRVETVTGRRVEVRQGVTQPIPLKSRCQRGPVLVVKEGKTPRAVADLGGMRLTPLTYRSVSAPSPTTRPGPISLRLWDRLACELPAPAHPVTEATTWEFWSGPLPDLDDRARWTCTRYRHPANTTTTHAALLEKKHHLTGPCDETHMVSGTWWRKKGRWYYLAAAAKGLTPNVQGPVRILDETERLIIATTTKPKRRPTVKPTLTAR